MPLVINRKTKDIYEVEKVTVNKESRIKNQPKKSCKRCGGTGYVGTIAPVGSKKVGSLYRPLILCRCTNRGE